MEMETLLALSVAVALGIVMAAGLIGMLTVAALSLGESGGEKLFAGFVLALLVMVGTGWAFWQVLGPAVVAWLRTQ